MGTATIEIRIESPSCDVRDSGDIQGHTSARQHGIDVWRVADRKAARPDCDRRERVAGCGSYGWRSGRYA